ncbi:MAG: hypothetical protein QN177_01440 [Armatimonadota bacterium]|nr:hypothetical protein [Armatimonadota bacterium]MDR7414089.1 hypothetical protein [Armatimonadota bacterium]MDR7428957.1 hypothetical protein [Armatimonadota bacterium]MDR7477998.1 hypothetical protein [Armatimonadota bacterium]MDR7514251.1 hypothetical protein [Armatimonadota bacterium]
MTPPQILDSLDREVAERIEAVLPAMKGVLSGLEAERRKLRLPALVASVPLALAALVVGVGVLTAGLGLVLSRVRPDLDAVLYLGLWLVASPLVPAFLYVPVLVLAWILYAPVRDRQSLRIRSQLIGALGPAFGFVPFQPEPESNDPVRFGKPFQQTVHLLVGGRRPAVRLAVEFQLDSRRVVAGEADVLSAIPKRRGFTQPGPPGRSGRQFYGLVAVAEGGPDLVPLAVLPRSGVLGRFAEWEPGLRSGLDRWDTVPTGDPEFDGRFEVYAPEPAGVHGALGFEVRSALLQLARELPWKPFLAVQEGYVLALLPWRDFLEPSPWRRMDARWVRDRAVGDLQALLRVTYLAGLASGIPGERLLERLRHRPW